MSNKRNKHRWDGRPEQPIQRREPEFIRLPGPGYAPVTIVTNDQHGNATVITKGGVSKIEELAMRLFSRSGNTMSAQACTRAAVDFYQHYTKEMQIMAQEQRDKMLEQHNEVKETQNGSE